MLGQLLASNLTQPQATPIATPLAQSVGGLQDVLPSLIGGAFGANKGLASSLAGPSSLGQTAPTFGRTPTREDLGIPAPTSYAPGFLPTAEEAQTALNPVRRTPYATKTARITNRLDELTAARDAKNAAGDMTTPWLNQRINRVQKRLDKRNANPEYL